MTKDELIAKLEEDFKHSKAREGWAKNDVIKLQKELLRVYNYNSKLEVAVGVMGILIIVLAVNIVGLYMLKNYL